MRSTAVALLGRAGIDRPFHVVVTRLSRGGPQRSAARLALAFVLVFAAGALGSPPLRAADSATTAVSLIAAAGNAQTETERLAHLRALAARAEREPQLLDSATRADLASLIPIVAAWAEGHTRAAAAVARGEGAAHRYLHDFFNQQAQKFEPVYPPQPHTASRLYPLWAFYRGRFLTWAMIEHSSIGSVPARRIRFLDEAERCFDVARAAFPHNPILGIYAGKNLPAPNLSPSDARAPAWANHQRRALEQIHAIIRWWIAERQLPNGEFGGNWGDDVEMWRWWAPVLIGFDDPLVNAAQERLARGNLARPVMAAGYTSQLTDVEHTAEETADTLTPLLHSAPDDPAAARSVHRLLELADAVWWGRNERGQLQFKHIDFNHAQLGADPGRAYDTAYHLRVLQPVLLLWQRSGDPALGQPITRWLRTWAEAALSRDNGKPSGIVPAALQWPSGLVGSAERGWIGPHLARDPMMDIYSWPHRPVAAMTAALLQAHVQTGDALFLEPLLKMAALRRAHLAAGDRDGAPGSAAWAAHRLPQIINDALAKWRTLTGDARFDDLLLADASGYVQRAFGGSDVALTAELSALADTLSVNWPMFTDEVRFTDRVLSFPHAWPRTAATGLKRIDTGLLYSAVTGDPGSVETFPLNGARWHTLPRELAVLVTENRRERFAAELYHFGHDERALAVSLLTLEPGDYSWTLTQADGVRIAEGKTNLTNGHRRLHLVLPPQRHVHLTLHR